MLETAEGIRENDDRPEPDSVAIRILAPDSEDTESEDDENDNPVFLNDLSEIQPQENEVSINDNDTEIRVSVYQDGNLVSTESRLADYQKRGKGLDDTCVWDFISRVDKVKKTLSCCKHTRHDDKYHDYGLGDDFNDEEAHGNLIDDGVVEEELHREHSVPNDSRIRPRVGLQSGHEPAKTHILIRAPDDVLLPVAIGTGIPDSHAETSIFGA
ncbi:hypothetical protein B0H14DRAFT_2588949 [Mycena olivaceomarginata]|nr:hypothetical protein B0H14DRAFT_2588949 [Mycena olivaceomarginata]